MQTKKLEQKVAQHKPLAKGKRRPVKAMRRSPEAAKARPRPSSPVEEGAEARWTEVHTTVEADASEPFCAELARVPGALAYGRTSAEAAGKAMAEAVEVLGERGQVRGTLLVEWLSLFGHRAHHKACVVNIRATQGAVHSRCHHGCLFLRTLEAVRGDGSLPRLKQEVGTAAPAPAGGRAA